MSLGADLNRVRHQVIQLLSGPQDPAEAQRAGNPAPARKAGPVLRCGQCGANLERTARYRTLAVPPVEAEAGSGSVPFTVVFCGVCGTAVGMQDAGTPPADDDPLSAALDDALGLSVWGQAFTSRVRLEGVAESARVDLSVSNGSLIVGTFGGAEVRLRLAPSWGRLSGVFAGVRVKASWQADDSPSTWEHAETIRGLFGGQIVGLEVSQSGLSVPVTERVSVIGDLAGQRLRAGVTGPAGLDRESPIQVDGTIAETPFRLGLLGRSGGRLIQGSIGDRPILLQALRDSRPDSLTIRGSYEGPPALLALIVCALVALL